MDYLFTNILGSFVFNENGKFIERSAGKLDPLPKEKVELALAYFKNKKFFPDFYRKNLELTKDGIKKSVSADLLIIQAVANIGELDRVNNTLLKRLREWYALYLPEFEHSFTNQEKFALMVLEKNRADILKDLKIKNPMGADLEEPHLAEIKELAQQVVNLQELKRTHEKYLEKVMKKHCPNLLSLAGITIGAKLVELGKGLKHLAMLPASTVQLLGAEKALFRHIKTGAKSPKYGVIINHPLIQKAKRDQRGKAARMLADKLSLCARLDFFKGEFKAEEYKKELEEKLG